MTNNEFRGVRDETETRAGKSGQFASNRFLPGLKFFFTLDPPRIFSPSLSLSLFPVSVSKFSVDRTKTAADGWKDVGNRGFPVADSFAESKWSDGAIGDAMVPRVGWREAALARSN